MHLTQGVVINWDYVLSLPPVIIFKIKKNAGRCQNNLYPCIDIKRRLTTHYSL